MRERLEQLSGVLLVIALSVFIVWTDPKPEPVPTPAKDDNGEWVTVKQKQPVTQEASDVEVHLAVAGDVPAGATDSGDAGESVEEFVPPTILSDPEKGGDPESNLPTPQSAATAAADGASSSAPIQSAAASSTEPAYRARMIQYSPSWYCQWCGPQGKELESITNAPFTVEKVTKDGMWTYPQVWFSTPEGNWKRFRGFTSAENIMSEWKKYHCRPAEKGTAENPGNERYERTLSLSRLQSMNADQLRGVIREWGQPLPDSGTVAGMTVTHHLVNDHGFSASVVAQLSESDRHRAHQLAHNLDDGRITATVRSRTVTTPHRQTYRWRSRGARRFR